MRHELVPLKDDVVSTLPNWIQQIVHTGCFHGASSSRTLWKKSIRFIFLRSII